MARAQGARKSTTRKATAKRTGSSSWAQQLSDGALLCRDIGHYWQNHDARLDQRVNMFRQSLRCGRCGTVRQRVLTRTGDIVSSSYSYPAEYLAPKGIGRIDASVRSTLRLTSITRIIAAAEEAAKATADNVVTFRNSS